MTLSSIKGTTSRPSKFCLFTLLSVKNDIWYVGLLGSSIGVENLIEVYSAFFVDYSVVELQCKCSLRLQ